MQNHLVLTELFPKSDNATAYAQNNVQYQITASCVTMTIKSVMIEYYGCAHNCNRNAQ